MLPNSSIIFTLKLNIMLGNLSRDENLKNIGFIIEKKIYKRLIQLYFLVSIYYMKDQIPEGIKGHNCYHSYMEYLPFF